MVTAYTSDLVNGKEASFKSFILKCARAFGPLVSMREDSLETQIPKKLEPDPYYAATLSNIALELRLAELRTDEQWEAVALKYFMDAKASDEQIERDRIQKKARLMAMRSKVADWTPPTSDHQELKDFMMEQIDSTVKFECFPREPSATRVPWQEYKQGELGALKRNVEYYAVEAQKEIDRTNIKNQWIADLRKSLPEV